MRCLPVPALTDKQISAFWQKVDRCGPNDCWPWLGCRTTTKWSVYGCLRIGDRRVYAHRVSYTLVVGPIPDGFTLDHIAGKCFLGALCCNPGHTEPVTQAVNHDRHYQTLARNGEGRRLHRLKKKHILSKPEQCRALHPSTPLSNQCPTCKSLIARYRREIAIPQEQTA